MLKNDTWIKNQAGMIVPFCDRLIRNDGQSRISYGLSSYGYDVRLSSTDFKIFKKVPGEVIDPKRFNPSFLESAKLIEEEKESYFILPAHSYGLGVSVEYFDIPRNITVICIGKSTIARCGVIANITPIESEWKGHLTLEFSNSSSSDCRLYANEGIIQLLFLEGEPCEISYGDRNGKYQNQPLQVVLAKV